MQSSYVSSDFELPWMYTYHSLAHFENDSEELAHTVLGAVSQTQLAPILLMQWKPMHGPKVHRRHFESYEMAANSAKKTLFRVFLPITFHSSK